VLRNLLLAGLLLSAKDVRADVLFLGDTYFGESYRALGGAAEYGAMLEAFQPILAAASLAVANLEAPITAIAEPPPEGEKRWVHRADPVPTTAALAAAGIDVLSLANNHAMDYGSAGLADTLAALQGAGLRSCGAGSDQAAADAPLLLQDGRPLVLLCAAEFRVDDALGFDSYAAGDKGGVSLLDPARLAAQIQAIRADTPAAFVVVFPHWGDNYEAVQERQRSDGHALIEAGADLVIGHGAHQLQTVERYRGRWIVYGIGNFVFGSPGRYAQKQAPPYSLIARLQLGETPRLLLYPIVTDNARVDYRPRFATRAEFVRARNLLGLGLPAEAEDAYGWYVALPLP